MKTKASVHLVALVDKMFEIANVDLCYEEVEGREDNWYQDFRMTEAQHKEWMEWGVWYMMIHKRYDKLTAQGQMQALTLDLNIKITKDGEYTLF